MDRPRLEPRAGHAPRRQRLLRVGAGALAGATMERRARSMATHAEVAALTVRLRLASPATGAGILGGEVRFPWCPGGVSDADRPARRARLPARLPDLGSNRQSAAHCPTADDEAPLRFPSPEAWSALSHDPKRFQTRARHGWSASVYFQSSARGARWLAPAQACMAVMICSEDHLPVGGCSPAARSASFQEPKVRITRACVGLPWPARDQSPDVGAPWTAAQLHRASTIAPRVQCTFAAFWGARPA